MIDIVQRLRFDAIRCETQFSKGVAGNITEAADEIERLRAAIFGVMQSSWEAPREPVHTVADHAYQRMVDALGLRDPGQ